jgi:alpha-L-rhamnosidase
MKKLFAFLLMFNWVAVCLANVHVSSLRCEYQSEPVGIDMMHPRLSWILESKDYNQFQTAYQILVASNPDLLTDKKADCWNSGKVQADTSINVNYEGISLQSLSKYYWTVRVWDKDDCVTSWSSTGSWTTGLMDLAEFQGQWISYSKPLQHEVYNLTVPLDLDHAKWIWLDTETKTGSFVFGRKIDIEDVTKLTSAEILLTADDSFKFFINGVSAGFGNTWSDTQSIDLLDHLKTGSNLFEIEVANTGGAAGMVCKIVFREGEQKSTVVVSDADWKVQGCSQLSLQADLVKEVAEYGAGPWGKVKVPGQDTFWTQKSPSPLLRKEFTLEKKIASSYAVVSGLGFYELRINGKKVGDKVLDPVFTNYEKTVLYSTYDITDYVQKGGNAVGIMLGNGWYNSHTRAAWNFDSAAWRDNPKALMDIVVNYTDGTSRRICTDSTWVGSNGPLVADAIRSGEVYDARLEQDGWDKPGFNVSWESVNVVVAPKGKLRSEIMPATKVHEIIKPVSIIEPKDGIYIVDMGVNIAGWVKLKVRGERGQKITVRYAEKLTNGLLDNNNIRGLTFSGPFQTDTYYLKGEGVEQWHPRFVYHGFRYVEVTGLMEKPTPDTIQAQMVYTDFEQIGTFKCSNDLFNTIQELTDRSYKSNFIGIPTDCPQREKNGWTADAHLAAEQAMLNYNNFLSYEKWLGDFRDDQDKEGRYSCIIPTPGWGARDLTEWDSAYMIIAWYLYLYYGDVKVIEDNYDNMKSYIANVERRIHTNDYVVEFGLGDWANDGGSVTPVPLTATAYFYYDLVLMRHFAGVLNRPLDVKYFDELSEKVKTAYNQKFYKGNGVYADGQQTALAMSMFYNLVPPSEYKAVQGKLLEAIEARDNHHDTGILGAKCIFRVLGDIGETDLAMTMLNQKTIPSYGYWIENGATSLYENWSKSPGSMNHIMYGDISAWFYSYLAGIQADPEKPGFKRIVIHPRFAEGLDWVNAKYDSPYGSVKVNWNVHGSDFICQVNVPVNTEAKVILETSNPQSIKTDEKHYKHKVCQDGRAAVYTLGSGEYTFTGIR